MIEFNNNEGGIFNLNYFNVPFVPPLEPSIGLLGAMGSGSPTLMSSTPPSAIYMNGGLLKTSGFQGGFIISPSVDGHGTIETTKDQFVLFDDISGDFKVYVSNLDKNGVDDIIRYYTTKGFRTSLDKRIEATGLYLNKLIDDGLDISIKPTDVLAPAAVTVSSSSVNSVNTVFVLSKALSNSVHKRLGELMWQFDKDELKSSNSGFARILTQDTKIKENGTIHSSLQGFEFGYDFKIPTKKDNVFIGLLGQISKTDTTYKRSNSRATGEIDGYAIGMYGLYFNDKGYFFDTVLRHHMLDQDVKDSLNNAPMNYDFKQSATTFTAEFGKQIVLNERQAKNDDIYFITPRIEGGYSYITSDDFTTSNGFKGTVESTTSIKLDSGFLIGAKYKSKKNINYSPYLKFGLLYEFDGDSESIIDGIRQKSDAMKGHKYELGGGFAIKMPKNTSLFFDTSFQKGKHTKDLGMVLGLRYDF